MAEVDVIIPDKVSEIVFNCCINYWACWFYIRFKWKLDFFCFVQDDIADIKATKDAAHSLEDLDTEDLYVKLKVYCRLLRTLCVLYFSVWCYVI